ncbi:hypothetical protein [Paraflavitalea speifideaquila]|uniref:GntT/GntP/DsdX family permease n=1 Tax=Paraflavitalea speifideaquila TaxID=3076558 RepID=UPI0028EAE902|nr:hypothetical protein [Paraflavitalea speifideiaquila]
MAWIKITHEYIEPETTDPLPRQLPPASRSFLPVVLPIALIAAKSMMQLFTPQNTTHGFFQKMIAFMGEPVIALAIGILVSFTLIRKEDKKKRPTGLPVVLKKPG